MKDRVLIAGRVEIELRNAINAWRRGQPDDIPTLSDAIGKLIRRGLEADASRKPKAEAA